MTQLILTHHYWAKALDDGCEVDVAFLGFSKAFNRLSHSVLLKKVMQLWGFWISSSMV